MPMPGSKINPSTRMSIALFIWAACLPAVFIASAQGVAVAPALAASAADEVLQTLQEQDAGEALEMLMSLVDQEASDDGFLRSGLPAAAAGIFRVLNQLSIDEQYALLSKWSLPTAERNSVRVLVMPVPVEAPPKAFARAIGERPRDTSFPIADVGGVSGLFCSGWMLVQTAEEVGRLSALVSQLDQLAAQQVSGANEMLLLAQIADRRSDTAPVQAYLNQVGVADAADRPNRVLIPLAIAAAALTQETLRPHSELALQRLAAQPTDLRPLIRIAHATAVQTNVGQSPATVLFNNRLKHWVPITGRTASLSRSGVPNAMWLTHEEHVLHLAGGSDDILFCRYPLAGEFDFICETQEGGEVGTDGGLVYGGLQFEALGSTNQLTINDADGNHSVVLPCPFVRHENTPTFNRVSFRATEARVAMESNFHPLWFDDAAAGTSPWIGLRSDGTNRPMFRDIRIAGSPTIPRQIALTASEQLRGWESGFFAQSQTPFSSPHASRDQPTSEGVDWQVQSGILLASAEADPSTAALPGLLRYQRPLLEGETISYEFEHGAGKVFTHPAVGRMIFLLRADGVQVRWMTDAPWDWTGLASDHSMLEPLNRRGPKALPLNENGWNRVAVNLAAGRINVTLNDQVVYQRPIDFEGTTQFGLYREHRHEEFRTRKVVMTGDWPEQVPPSFLENPVATDDEIAPPADRRALLDAVEQEPLAANTEVTPGAPDGGRARHRVQVLAERHAYLHHSKRPTPIAAPDVRLA